jgi:PAS domain S-box-containing protein
MPQKPTYEELELKIQKLEQAEAGREKAENALKESEKRLRELAELLPEGVFESDLNMNLTFVNLKGLTMFGYTRNDFEEGMNGLDMLAKEDRQRARENFIKRMKGERSGASEYRGVKKDGTLFPILLHVSPIIKNNIPTGLRGVIIDMTEPKKMEGLLIEAQKMESIGTLAGGIAHDFNNILAPIVLHSDLLISEFAYDDPVKLSLKEIHKAAIRARDLVKQILTFARRGLENKVVFKAAPAINDMVKFLRATIPSTIDIRYDNRALNDTIFADPIHLNQIVMNLSTNAAYAMRDGGGRLEIILTSMEITKNDLGEHPGLDPGQYLILTVKDTGTGIPPEILDKIFDPYFTTKRPGEGTGLGLAIIFGIVKSCNGAVIVKSPEGEGTTFQVYLPLIDENLVAPVEESGEIEKGGERILLVDDETSGLNAMRKTLESLGYIVSTSESGVGALELFKNAPLAFDLVITDMTMPVMTGKELVKEITCIRPGMPVILCTGFSDQIDENEAARMGICAFILKPVIRTEIARAIRQALDKGK